MGAHTLRDLEHLLLGLRGQVSVAAGPASLEKLAAGRLGRLEGARERLIPEFALSWIPPLVLGPGKVVMPCERMHPENFSPSE